MQPTDAPLLPPDRHRRVGTAPRQPMRAVGLAALVALLGAWSGAQAAGNGTAASGANGLPQALRDALHQANIPEQAVSVLVLPLPSGPGDTAPLIAHRVNDSRPVASVMKLFTTGAALLARGPASTWHTDIGLTGPLDAQGRLHGDVVIRGGGDPALVTELALQMMVRWQAAGLRAIDGDLVLDRSAFELPAHDPAAFDGEALKPYNAGPDALLVNQQAVTLKLLPDAARPQRWRLSLEPALAQVTVRNLVRADARAFTPEACAARDWREGLQVEMAPQPATTGHVARAHQGLRPWQLTVRGELALACGPRDWPLLWQGDGPGDHAARALLASWQQLGGTLGGQVKSGRWPDGLAVWQRWTSPPLAQVVRDINKFSNNVMARQLMLGLALQDGPDAPVPAPPVTLDSARSTLQTLVTLQTQDSEGRTVCDAAAWQVDNGSGLSRDERSTAACLGRWMQRLWASPVMPEWLASLPVVGVDGTARRWTGPAAGRAHIKTGSLDGVATMAGVVDGDSGRRWAVVALGQHPQGASLRAWYAQLLGWVARQ